MVRVVDASVAIKWFVEEKGREKSIEILSQILHQPGHFAVPELFFFELAHVFNRLIPHPTKMQTELLILVFNFGMHRFSMTPELLALITSFQKKGLTGYDGAYVALAKSLKGKWITFDREAHTLLATHGLSEYLGMD